MKSSAFNIFILLLSLVNYIYANDSNQTATKSIDFVVNECTLSIPKFYDIAVSSKGNIVFTRSLLYGSKENEVYISLNFTEENATKIVLDDLNKSSRATIEKIKREKNLIVIYFVNEKNVYIIGKHFYLYVSKYNVYIKKLIDRCNETWSNDMYIEGLDTLANKILEDFYYTPLVGIDKERALKIQKKLERIYEKSLK